LLRASQSFETGTVLDKVNYYVLETADFLSEVRRRCTLCVGYDGV
jgi:hypothetical protein